MIWAKRVALLIASFAATVAWRPAEYPSYCSKNMNDYAIPELSQSIIDQYNPTIKQAQVIIRHGARTPYAKFFCWENYDVAWNCNVTELMVPSPTNRGNDRPAPWLFRKLYDGSPNLLGGTCYTGQLLVEGYEQEESNGRNLRAAYIGAGNTKLFSTPNFEDLDQRELYFRADDEQRTIMSAQVLLHTFFNVSEESIVPFHTGDYDLDTLYPNDDVCPRLDVVEDDAYDTTGWKAGNDSTEAEDLTNQLTEILGNGWDWYHVLDCFMTAVCTDRDLPDGMDQQLFDDTIDHVEWQYAYPAVYNNSFWSKLALGHITYEIRERMQAVMDGANKQYKFVLYAGHDTTIMPFLASLQVWDQQWASYASIVSIELWETESDGFFFRLVYNGQELTLPGCDNAFCSVDFFLDATAFAQDEMPCEVEASGSSSKKDKDDDDELSQGTWAVIVVFSTLGGLMVGAVVTFFALRKREQGELHQPLKA